MPGGNTATNKPSNQQKSEVFKLFLQQKKIMRNQKLYLYNALKDLHHFTILIMKKGIIMFLHIQKTQSGVSADSNTSLDLSGIINFQRDLDKIKFSLKDLTT